MTLKEIAKREGFPEERAESFMVMLKDNPYVTTEGLLYKANEKYGDGNYAVQGMLPTPEEYSLLRRMMGLKDDEPAVLIRGEVWVKGFERPFVDYGTATPKNLKGFVTFNTYPVEMATRRATNRALRLATNCGMCSIDEIDTEIKGDNVAQENDEPPKTDGPPMTEKQRGMLEGFVDSTWLGIDEQDVLRNWLKEPHTVATASKAIAKYLELKDERTKDLQVA